MSEHFLIRTAVEQDTASMVKVNVDTLRATYQNFYPAELLAARNYPSSFCLPTIDKVLAISWFRLPPDSFYR